MLIYDDGVRPNCAFLVELFPTRMATSIAAVSHRQRVVRRHAAAAATALVAANGDIYYGLWYLIVVALITAVVGFLFLYETKNADLHADVIPGSAAARALR
jgi:hypothetical protein